MPAEIKQNHGILIADDFPAMRQIIRNFLRELGFRNIREAADGQAALEIIREGDINLLITDWKMPVLEGLQLLQTVRSDPATATLPVIMVAAEARQEQIAAAIEAGVDGYIVKPFTAETLAGKIKALARGAMAPA